MGVRSTAVEPQEGQTSGFWSRSAAIRISASGARYSFTPLRPTGLPFRQGTLARNWLPHLPAIYEIDAGMQRSARTPRGGGNHMLRWVRAVGIALSLTGGVSLAADAQESHVVRLEVDSDKGEYT